MPAPVGGFFHKVSQSKVAQSKFGKTIKLDEHPKTVLALGGTAAAGGIFYGIHEHNKDQ